MARKHVTRIAAGIAALVLLGIFLFRASPPGLLHTIQPPSGKPGFHTMALSPDGKTLATGSHRSSAITFWDVDTGKRTSTLDNGTTGIDRILYSPRGDQILVFSQYSQIDIDVISALNQDKGVRLRSLPDGRLLHTLPQHGRYKFSAFSEDGAAVRFGTHEDRLTVIASHNTQDGSLIGKWDFPRSDGFPSQISPDGRHVFVQRSIQPENSGTLWDMLSNEPVKSLTIRGVCHKAAISTDNRKLVFSNGMTTISAWSIPNSEQLITYDVPGTRIESIAVSHDGSLILSGDRCEVKERLTAKLARALGLNIQVHPRIIPPAGGFLSCGKTGRILRTFPGHDLMIHTVAFTPDTTRAITASMDRIQIWDISDLNTETQP